MMDQKARVRRPEMAPNPRPKPIAQPELQRALEPVSGESFKFKQNKDLFIRPCLA
jgi:hypothetical protein